MLGGLKICLILGHFSEKIRHILFIGLPPGEKKGKNFSKSLCMIQSGGIEFIDSVTRIQMIKCFFNFNIPFMRIQFKIQKYQETYFLPTNK
uniref:Translation initiation factor 1 n=1 Tax=Pentadiplandra brazzeana TaxID=43545 RepID=A0A5B9R249_PENBA|nr:translation initiation factor 1 [Pentadiplandra brazzeana]QEG53856.1 translation initiation factor 1 [Pentadiplandra brazzeana]